MDLSAAALDRATIPLLAHRMAAGELTAADLTRAYLGRIAEVDPVLRSVLAVDPTAVGQAEESDLRRARGESRGVMDGIPVLIKDNIDTAGLATTAGSRALSVPPSRDAPVVTRLREAGAVVLGKTNMTEWSNFRSPWATSGWSAVGGQTVNPHVLDRTPCGSSSGSAVAVAASLAQVAVGTETSGSIVSPAGHAGVVGFKPSPGRVSASGIVPITACRDTAGPLARHVVDAAVLMAVMAGGSGGFEPRALAGVRVGVWRRSGFSDEVDTLMSSVVELLRCHGVDVVDVEPGYQAEIQAADRAAMPAEFRVDLERYLSSRSGVPRTLRELIAFNQADPVELSLFGQEVFFEAEKAVVSASCRRVAVELARRSLDEVLSGVDVLLAPTNGVAWVASGADPAGPRTALAAAVAGYPNLSVPGGFAGGLPLGVSVIGRGGEDDFVLRVGAGVEAVLRARRAPRFLASV